MMYRVNALIPIRLPLRHDGEENDFDLIHKYRSMFIEQLESYFSYYYSNELGVKSMVVLEYKNLGQEQNIPEELQNKLPKSKYHYSLPPCEIISTCIDVAIDLEEVEEENPDRNSEDLAELSAVISVYEPIKTALFLSELCFPGCVSSLEGVVSCGKSRLEIAEKSSFNSLHVQGEKAMAWPVLQEYSLSRAHSWANKIGFQNEWYAKSRISRALAAFIHTLELTELRNGEQLFRAMQGLEAFYCDGVGDLRKQLQDKTQAWLGEWQSIYSCGKLYSIRSKFVHGSSLVEYSSFSDVDADEFELEEEVRCASLLASRLLLGTLQKCIKEEASDIFWKVDYEIQS